MSNLNKQLMKLYNSGESLPSHLVLNVVCTEPAGIEMPVQLEQLAPGGRTSEFDMALVKWLTRWEKCLVGFSTLPLATVCLFTGNGIVTAAGLQIAFACDLRAAQPNVRLRFSTKSGLLPGTLTFKLAKHVMASNASSLLLLDQSISAQDALRMGAIQHVADDFDIPLSPPIGAQLLFCRWMLGDGVWLHTPQELKNKLQVWQVPFAHNVSEKDVTSDQIDELASFFPDQFIMPTEAWQWKISWSPAPRLTSCPSTPEGPKVTFATTEKESLRTVRLEGRVLTMDTIHQFLDLLPDAVEKAMLLCIILPGELWVPTDKDSVELFGRLIESIEGMPVQAVTHFQGTISAAGMEIGLASGHRIASPGVEFALTSFQEGTVPGARVWSLARSIGCGRFSKLMLCPSTLSAKELETIGCATFMDEMQASLFIQALVDELPSTRSSNDITPDSTEVNGVTPYSVKSRSLSINVANACSATTLGEHARSLRELAKLTEVRDTRQRSSWLLNRLPQLEPASGIPLMKLNLPAIPIQPPPRSSDDITTLKVQREGSIATVTINRPARANAYDSAMLSILEKLVSTLEQERTLAVVFASSDKRFFCAGADLERVSNPRAEDALSLHSQRVFDMIAKASFLSIAVVEGAAVAGGFEWALACDVRIASPSARFWLPETQLGLIPAAGGCTRLTELVGAARAKQVILFHEKLDAQRALDWGVVQQLSETPMTDARLLAGRLSSDHALARQLAKQVIDGVGGGATDSLKSERVAEGLLYEAKHTPRAIICGIGKASPDEVYTQREVADLLKVNDLRMRAIYSAAHIQTRCLAEIASEQERTVTQGQLVQKHLRWSKRMSQDAVPMACAAAGIRKEDIQFIVVCTTTGFLSPGLSAHIATHLRLSPHIQRADIVGMGCHAGLNTMCTAAHWAEANPGCPALMLCVEVVSAGYMWDAGAPDMAMALTNALFGDGCACAILMCPTPQKPISSTEETIRPMLYGFESMLVPDTLDSLCYEWLDDYNKFSFTISPQVPYLMGLKIPVMLKRLLDKFRLKKEDVSHWVVHSGGKKVLDCVMYSLGLSKHAIRHSLSSLKAMGNMSSGSFLWAYDSLLKEKECKPGDYGVFITMGPGAGIECALWRA